MSKRPRTKKNKACPNPLYLKWLEEWRDEARDKGSKMQHTYAKAISSLKKYPLPLSCGEEAKILDGIGNTIACKLDEAYTKYLKTCEDDEPFYRTNAMPTTGVNDREYDHEEHYTALHVSLPEVGQGVGRQTGQSKRQKKTREYVPAYRSGAYALLVTLYRKSQQTDYRGFMSKSELQREAQPLSETSLTLPDPGTQYTAWSSMSTLIKKGYVLKISSPAKYSITDAGCELADKLLMASDSQQTSSSSHPIIVGACRPPDVPPSFRGSPVRNRNTTTVPDVPLRGSPTNCTRTLLSNTRVPEYIEPDFTQLKTHKRPTSFSSLKYWYISDNGRCVKRKDQALVSVNDIVCPGFLIKCEDESLVKSPLRYSIDETRPRSGKYIYAYLHDEDASEFCTADSLTDSTAVTIDEILDDEDLLPPFELVNSAPAACSYTKGAQKCVIDSDEGDGTLPTKEINFTPEFALKPGSFEIVLCVDNVETVGGSSNSRKKELIPELQSNGVLFDVRKLHVGDFLWVAREKTSSNHFHGQRHVVLPCELVLDYVVERKRMDDLCSSIIDGRFKEQKFRLRRSGLQHPIYLVEDFGSIQHMSLPEATLQQAIVNTQVVDRFTVKRTSCMKESVAYLTIMTRYLQSLYSDKTLICCPRDCIEQLYTDKDQFSKLHTSHVYLMSFPEFNESTVKNRVMTVGEVFAKQLMQICGMSADKVVALLEKYPTPWRLMQAYEAQPTEKERELMLATLKPAKSQRSFGPAISKIVYQLYCSKGPLQ